MPAPPYEAHRRLNLGPDFLRRLEALGIAAGRVFASGGVATRAGSVRGGRVEFLEHRGYVEGDDLRNLDWNVYGRTNELFTKVFGAEREKTVHLVLDLSSSMAAVPGKDIFACRLAAALAHIALAAGDAVHLLPTRSSPEPPPRRGLSASREFVRYIEALPLGPALSWPVITARFTSRPRPPGATIIISDFWTSGAVPSLIEWAKRRQTVALLHALTPEEMDPPMRGSVRLEDAETGEEVSLALGQHDLDAYRLGVQNHIQSLAAQARRRGMLHLLCRTDVPFEQMVLTYLRRGGLLR